MTKNLIFLVTALSILFVVPETHAVTATLNISDTSGLNSEPDSTHQRIRPGVKQGKPVSYVPAPGPGLCEPDTGSGRAGRFLGKFPRTMFSQAGDVSPSQRLTIMLRHCRHDGVDVMIDAKVAPENPDVILTHAGKTGYLGMQLLNNDDEILRPGDYGAPFDLSAMDSQGTRSLTLKARWIALKEIPEPVDARTEIQVVLRYK